ncbi:MULTISPECIES: hypothetical protein [unclassified Endozoicomonas]|uniref:hypothetical protein n=2 Tax=Endozoicomonas TaxID=305899 RepID=UPI002149805B|nr:MULTISPECIES: hypothetical protein [unclassified Endozoicomonas]
MNSPSGTASPSSISDQNVQTGSAMFSVSRHPPGSTTTMYSMRRCYEHKYAFRTIWLDLGIPEAPDPPLQSHLLKGAKRLESRTVEVSSSRQASTDSRKHTEASEAEIQAELERMHERIQEDHQRYSELYKLFMKARDIARQAEHELDVDVNFLMEASLCERMDQQQLGVMADELHEKTTMLEAKDWEIRELERKIRTLTQRADTLQTDLSEAQQQIDQLNNAIFEHREEKSALLRQTEQLTNKLREKTTILEAKEEQMSVTESQNVNMLRRLNDMHQKLTARGADVVPKDMLSQLQNDLRQTRSLLQAKEDEASSRVAQSRQWATDRAVMEREIETLRAELRALSMGSQTTETRASP